MADKNETRRTSARPTITPPPRTHMEALFTSGSAALSPGPMTLVSSFFSDSDECKSFSQLLAGAMTSPAGGRSSGDVGFRLSQPPGMVVAPPPSTSPAFVVSQGLSSAALFDSNGMFLLGQGAFGMTHQQALPQITAQAVQTQSLMHIQGGFASSLSASRATSATRTQSFTTSTSTNHHAILTFPDPRVTVKESSEVSHLSQSSQSSTLTVDKPADDGYRWRKYGQKQVKGSEFPRSYYKCTHPNCPVTKKVERSLDGQVTEIIYKGQHNHQPPQGNKRAKDGDVLNGTASNRGEHSSHVNFGSFGNMSGNDHEFSQATAEHIIGSSDSEDVGGGMVGKDEDERDPKRRIVEAGVSEPAHLHRSVAEPRIIVQTTSEVDLLDDGYRWRKYGQKVVKGNPYPRSYYKCTTPGCNVRKHIERSPADPKAVITTYEGKHTHDVPAAKSSSHNLASSNASQFKSYNSSTQKHALINQSLIQSNSQEVAHLRLKEEQIT